MRLQAGRYHVAKLALDSSLRIEGAGASRTELVLERGPLQVSSSPQLQAEISARLQLSNLSLTTGSASTSATPSTNAAQCLIYVDGKGALEAHDCRFAKRVFIAAVLHKQSGNIGIQFFAIDDGAAAGFGAAAGAFARGICVGRKKRHKGVFSMALQDRASASAATFGFDCVPDINRQVRPAEALDGAHAGG